MRKSGAKPTKRLPLLGAGAPASNDGSSSSSSQFSSFSISASKTAAGSCKTIRGFGDTDDYDEKQPARKEIQLESEESLAERETTTPDMRSIAVPKNTNGVLNAARPKLDDLPDRTEYSEYDRVPVEDFGMMMLRGMGLAAAENSSNDGDSDLKQETLRPSLLGLGAKQNNASIPLSRSKRRGYKTIN
ncbi:Pre-mRNA-splicing factor spp2 [Coemansia sp. RSA 2399]|nr:Pre-mRNA-splicing factor spp2 [Coemansia sp. RSA 2399]KAJ1904785.1 Pre-mRNA-splicing factor spp2 [Coemansia sp. IMI 209127]